MIKHKVTFILFLSLFAAGGLLAAKPAPAVKKAPPPPAATVINGLTAADMPYDVGNSAVLKWAVNPAYATDTVYVVYVSTLETGGWLEADRFAAAAKTGKDIELPFW